MNSDPLIIAGKTFRSRLVVGTGKYPSHAVMRDAHLASGAEMVTVAVRRVNLSDRTKESLLDYIDRERIFIRAIGLVNQDIALADHIYRRALETGIGTRLPY